MNLPHFTLKPENQSHLPVGRMTFTLQPLLLPDLILVPIGPLLIRIICVTPPQSPLKSLRALIQSLLRPIHRLSILRPNACIIYVSPTLSSDPDLAETDLANTYPPPTLLAWPYYAQENETKLLVQTLTLSI